MQTTMAPGGVQESTKKQGRSCLNDKKKSCAWEIGFMKIGFLCVFQEAKLNIWHLARLSLSIISFYRRREAQGKLTHCSKQPILILKFKFS